ncbi:MAG TPA: hypothetical protein VIM30_07250 [Candidatus Limnocylindrales bacterium]|jgi:hypothetical protein
MRRPLLAFFGLVFVILAAKTISDGNVGGGTPSRTAGPVVPAAQGPSDTQLTATMIGNIKALSGSAWYGSLHLNGTDPDVSVSSGVLFVATLLPQDDTTDGASICHSVAAITNDPDTAKPLGILSVVVISGGKKIADCRP